jgi:hypothetical protein
MERAEPPLQAEIMMSISMTLSLILLGGEVGKLLLGARRRLCKDYAYSLLPLCTMKTSWSRTEVSIVQSDQYRTCGGLRIFESSRRRRTDLDGSLAIAEFPQRDLRRLRAETGTYGFDELRV